MDFVYGLHNHTSRCGHAQGKDEEYVANALKAGYELYGFSDHAFLPGVSHPKMRGDLALLPDYVQSVSSLKKSYGSKLDIRLGFEIEYQHRFLDYYRSLFVERGFDYLILGQHLTYSEDGKPLFYFTHYDDYAALDSYADDVIEGMKSGYFLYFCHPDLFMCSFTHPCPEIVKASDRICEAAKALDIPLEINLGGLGYADPNAMINGTMPYPNHYFFKEAAKFGCSAVIGIDAHNPEKILHNDLPFALRFAEAHALKLIRDPAELMERMERIKARILAK